MNNRIYKIVLIVFAVILFLVLLLVMGIGTTKTVDQPTDTADTQKGEIVFKSFYAEVLLTDDVYYYNIRNVLQGTFIKEPIITLLDNSIAKIELADGTNNNTVRYVDLLTGEISEEILMISNYTETTFYREHYYVAYPTYNEEDESVFRIQEMFTGNYQDYHLKQEIQAFEYTRIITFLNEEELYLEYDYYDPSLDTTTIVKETLTY